MWAKIIELDNYLLRFHLKDTKIFALINISRKFTTLCYYEIYCLLKNQANIVNNQYYSKQLTNKFTVHLNKTLKYDN